MLKFLLFVLVLWFILRFVRRIFMVSARTTTFTNKGPRSSTRTSRRSTLDEIEEAEYIEIPQDEKNTKKE